MERHEAVREPVVVVGSAHEQLGNAIAAALGTAAVERKIQRFPDGELEITVTGQVRGRDVFLVQPTMPPVGEHLLELLLLGDACERAGARTATALLPYFGYARQDRRRREGQPLGAQVVTNILQSLPFSRVLAVDLHSATVEGCLNVPLEHLTALPLLVEAIRGYVGPESVIVAPDFGAAKLAEAFATRLKLPLCIVHKTRLSGANVAAHGVVGEVAGRKPILIDDMISTGGTIAAAAGALRSEGCADDLTVVATHGLFVGDAFTHLANARITRLITTDSVPPPSKTPMPHHVVGLAPLLADAIGRLRDGRLMAELLADR